MPYSRSTYHGDAEFAICCTGDAVVGDQVRFERAVFGGSYKRPRFLHFELVTGNIVGDSYGAERQQHTFTIELAGGQATLIKGRNLYREGVWRKPWPNESERKAALVEKHARGEVARAFRGRATAGGRYGSVHS